MTTNEYIMSRSPELRAGQTGTLPTGRRFRTTLEAALERFWQSRAYFPAMLLLAALCLVFPDELPGVVVFAGIAALYFYGSDDFLAAVTPVMLMALLSVTFYDDYREMLQYWWMGAVLACALFYHATYRCRVMQSGKCLRGLLAVSVASLLGGTGAMAMRERLSLLPLYYTLGIGVGMVVFYLIFHASLCIRRSYSVARRFLAVLYALGLAAAMVVGMYYLRHMQRFLATGTALSFSYRNYCATILLMAFPAPFYFARRRGAHLLSVAVLYAAMLFTGSRSALLFGTLLLVCGMLYLAIDWFRRCRRRLVPLAAVMLVLLLGGILAARFLFVSRLSADGGFISADDDRFAFLRRAAQDFLTHPLFGTGLGNLKNSDIFSGVPGSMTFYHNYFAQILGSMGVVGAGAYALLLRDRVVLLFKNMDATLAMLAMSYGGMLLISMTNPGEFCPFPYEMLVVMLFAVAEQYQDEKRLRNVKAKKRKRRT